MQGSNKPIFDEIIADVTSRFEKITKNYLNNFNKQSKTIAVNIYKMEKQIINFINDIEKKVFILENKIGSINENICKYEDMNEKIHKQEVVISNLQGFLERTESYFKDNSKLKWLIISQIAGFAITMLILFITRR